MPQISSATFDNILPVLSLLALALYLAPATFGPEFAARNRPWMHRAAVAILVIGFAIALAMSALWFMR
jgi:hypothetical protein